MKVRLRCTAGIHGTPWREVPASGMVVFERNEFGDRRDLPTDFIVDLAPSEIVLRSAPVSPSRRRLPWWRK